MGNANLPLIADKAALYFLEQSDHESEAAKETKHLIMRVIAGDNPTQNEWRDNAIAHSNIPTYSGGHTYAQAHAITYAYNSADNPANNSANLSCYAYFSRHGHKIVDYIIELLDGYIKPMADSDSKVLTAINADGWKITLHPQGEELEKYLGSWLTTMIIHKITTGETVYASHHRRNTQF